MRRTSWDIQIDRYQLINPVTDLFTPIKGAPVNRASTYGYHNLGISNRFVGFFKRQLHILCHGASDHESIGVPGGSHKFDTKTRQVKNDIVKGLYFRIAPVTASGTDFP